MVFLLAANLVALAGFASALAKTIQEPDPFRMHRDRFFALANSRWFCLIEFGLSAMLLAPAPMIAQALAAAFLATTIIGREIRQWRHPEEESEGFGSMSPSSRAAYLAVGGAVAAAAGFVVFEALRTPAERVPVDLRLVGATLALLITIALKLRYDESRGRGYAHKNRDPAAIGELPANLVIGRDARSIVTARELASMGRSALIVALFSQSQDSRDVYALLCKHADLLSRELTVVAIAENGQLYRDARGTSLRRLVDSGSYLGRFLGIHARPFAMLLGEDLAILAPPSQTPHKVQRLITLLVTSIQNAPTSLLKLDGEEQPDDAG